MVTYEQMMLRCRRVLGYSPDSDADFSRILGHVNAMPSNSGFMVAQARIIDILVEYIEFEKAKKALAAPE